LRIVIVRAILNSENMNHPDEEMFDDLHQGVEALKEAASTQTIPLSQKAVESIQRLENAVPMVRSRFVALKKRIADQALRAAKKTNTAVREHPWLFTLSALGMGLLAGVAITSGENEEPSEG